MAILSLALVVHSTSETPLKLRLSNTTTSTPENQSEPSKSSYNLTSTDQDDEQLLTVLAIDNSEIQQPLVPQYFASSSPPAAGDDPLSLNYASPPPYYDEAFAPELDEILSPQYPPSPAPSFEALAPEPADEYDFSPEYPSRPPYDDVMAPEFAHNNDEFYSPLEAPTFPTPVSTTPASDSDVVPTPGSNMVSPFTYQADGQVPEFDEQETKGKDEFGEMKKRTVVGFVIFSVCLVGLGGFVYKKRKDDHMRRSSQYQCLSKKELEL
ncbi:hypothetical protein FNV43_RR16751 [Rhamnella rubrinervis]|uniref:Uncharacterized protein n=1 Tax=Rhamnella rubrinervis TaxID=2594499 RepID=A0A8K0GZD5_9ROSA|nr:hypothetical protein FNV43_RR16751 [Rhamnella rubrinervis]